MIPRPAAAPDDPSQRIELALSLVAKNEIYPAIGIFEGILADQPGHLRANLELGLLYLRLGAIPKGRDYLQRALAAGPDPEQRRAIELLLREQAKLDPKRYYRPDFEALHRQEQASGPGWIGKLLRRLRGRA